MQVYGYFNVILSQVMLVNAPLFPCLCNVPYYFYTKFPDFINTSKTSRQVDVDDTK